MRDQVATVENVNNFEGGVVIPFTVLGQQNTKLMDMLTDKVYKDSAMAVVREYTTNALDSHIAAGQTRPVEITTPSRLHPFFIVQDFGVGLDLDDIEQIYTRYVESTKTEDDEATGNLGIGSKAALGYVGQYTVSSVKNGQKIVGIVTRNDAGNPVMICDVSNTDEPNGVKITVPVNADFEAFQKKIKHFHQFLQPGLLLVDGQEADRSQFQSIGDNMEINYELSHDYIVMGSVAYPVDRDLYPKLHSYSIVTHVQMGEVQFTQSREEMNYTKRTKAVLDKYREMFKENIYEYMKKAIEGCENRRVAYNLQYEFLWNTNLQQNGCFTYKGKVLPDNFSRMRGQNADTIVYEHYRWNYSYDAYCRKIKDGSALVLLKDDAVYVTNWTNARFTRVQADKLDLYLQQNDLNTYNNNAILINGVDPELLEGLTVVDWEEVRKVKIPGRSTVPSSAKKYFGVSEGSRYSEFVPDATKKIWYGMRQEITTRRYPNYDSLLGKWNNPGEQFVFVTRSQRAKFLKTYPNAVHFRMLYHDQYEAFLKSLTSEDYRVISSIGGVAGGRMLIADQILDPDLKAAVNFTQNLISDEEKASLDKYEKGCKLESKCSWEFTNEVHKKYPRPERAGKRQDLHRKYPLLECVYQSMNSEPRQHLTDYVNYVYQNEGV